MHRKTFVTERRVKRPEPVWIWVSDCYPILFINNMISILIHKMYIPCFEKQQTAIRQAATKPVVSGVSRYYEYPRSLHTIKLVSQAPFLGNHACAIIGRLKGSTRQCPDFIPGSRYLHTHVPFGIWLINQASGYVQIQSLVFHGGPIGKS